MKQLSGLLLLSFVIIASVFAVILMPCFSSAQDKERNNSFMVAQSACGPIPQCGTQEWTTQRQDRATGRWVAVRETRCTCCMIVECHDRIRAWRAGNWGSRWRAPNGCAFGSCPSIPNIYYFAPEIPRGRETRYGGPRS